MSIGGAVVALGAISVAVAAHSEWVGAGVG